MWRRRWKINGRCWFSKGELGELGCEFDLHESFFLPALKWIGAGLLPIESERGAEVEFCEWSSAFSNRDYESMGLVR